MTPALTRRQALGLFGGASAGAAALLAGCQVQVAPEQGSGADAPPIELPDPAVELPTEDITFRWLDGGGNRKLYQEPLFAAYQEKHSNITVQYDGTNMDTLNETVPLGVRNGTAPDVFAIGNKIKHRTAIDSGWCQPIEDVVPDFEAWQSAFPEGSFVPNVHVFDGKVYSFPLTGSGDITEMIIHNVSLLEKAGVDPERDIATWDQFRAAAKKIAESGKGQYYGLMNSRTPVKIADGLLSTVGFQGGLDLTTGEYAYDADDVFDVVDLLLAIHSDGSFWPDFAGISAADARGRMPNNVAGLQVDGPYSIVEWEQADFEFGMGLMPTREAGDSYTCSYNYGGGSNVFVFAEAKYPNVAGDLFSYMGSIEGQVQLVLQARGALKPSHPDAMQQAIDSGGDIDPNFTQVRELSDQVMRVGPEPVVRNADVAMVEEKPVKPGWSDLLGGMLTGQVSDIKAELRTLTDQLNKNLDTAIAEARADGADVSREDFVFPNWDQSVDYTQADYDAL